MTTTFSIALSLFIASSAPYAVIDGTNHDATDTNNYPVLVHSLDGEAYWDGRDYVNMKPGFHYLEIISTKPGKDGYFTELPFAIMAKPCVRYELSAQHVGTLDNDRWAIRVLGEKPIGSCNDGKSAAAAKVETPAPAASQDAPAKSEGAPAIAPPAAVVPATEAVPAAEAAPAGSNGSDK